jgi:hypothetical protein
MYAMQGFEPCDRDDPSSDKIAIYAKVEKATNELKVTHAAIQKSSWGGKWRSKLGFDADIEHELDALEGGEYGAVAQLMRKRARN